MVYKIHPAAELFPLLTGDSLKEMVADIKQNGLLVPIELYEGQVIDGRNRLKACESAGQEPEFVDIQCDDPWEYVLSLNLHRRHLNESQRSAVAAKIATRQNGSNQHEKEGGQIYPPSIKNAAKRLNVSEKSVKSAKKVQAKGTKKLNDAVESGKVRVSDAAKIVDKPKAEQNAAVKAVESGKAKTVSQSVSKPSTPKVAPSGKTKCLCCDGSGFVSIVKSDQSFDSWWQVILANAATGSRLKTNRVKASKAWPKALAKLAKTHNDPAGFLRAKIHEYIASSVGQSEFALNPERLLNDEFWNDPTDTWEGNDRESIAKRNQTYDPSHENFGVVQF